MENTKQYTFRDPKRLALWMRIVCIVQFCIFGASIVSFWMQYVFLTDFQAGNFASQEALSSSAQANDARVALLGGVSLVAIIVAEISLFVWIYRASANAHALGAVGLTSPGMSVGCFFIPFANLVMPAMAVSEIARASEDASRWKEGRTPWLVPLWWTFWIGMGIGGFVMTALIGANHDVESLKSATRVFAGYKIIEIIAYALLLALTARISQAQRAQHARRVNAEASFL